MKQQPIFLSLLIAALVALAACSTAEETLGSDEPAVETSDNLTENPVGLKVTIAQRLAAAPAFHSLAAATGLTISEATLNLEYVKFKMPEGQNCGNDSDDQMDSDLDDDGDDIDDIDEEDSQEEEHSDDVALSPDAEDSNTNDDADEDDDEESEHHRDADCDGDDIRFEGPFAIDLTDGSSTPSLEDLAIPAGTYTRIKLKISDSEAPGTLEDLTLLASGTYVDATTSFEVSMALKFDEEIVIEPASAIVIDPVGGENFLVQFPVANWLDGIDLAACYAEEASGSSILQIDDRDDGVECDGLEDTLKNNFKNSGSAEEEEPEDDETHAQDEEDSEGEEDEQESP